MADNAEELKRQRRNKEPLAYCKWMAEKPCLWFGITLGGHILIVCINFILLGVGYDILPIVFNAFPIDIKKDLIHQRENAWNDRDTDNEKIVRFTVDDIGPTWPRGYHTDTVTFYYTAGGKGSNVFQKKYFMQMEEIEDGIFHVEEYQSSFCQLNEDLSCRKPISVLRYFDGTFANISDVFYDPNYDNISGVLYEANTNQMTKDDFQYFLAKGYIISPNDVFANTTRTGFRLGWPLERSGDNSEMYERLERFVEDRFKPVLDEALDKPYDGLQLNYLSGILFGVDILPQAFKDMLLAAGSLGFILVFIWIQTASFWITGWAVFSIITCFWITNLIYRTIINYAYFGFFHIIAIFIILGIGADDVFVFFNTWKATAADEYPSLSHRMSDVYRRAAGTMFFTSFTTMMAFFMSGTSPVLPLGSFGIFTGVLVAVNYVSVIVFFPNVVLMHHLYFEERCCTCCVCPHERRPQRTCCGRHDTDTGRDKAADTPHDSVHTGKKQKHPIVRFFAGPYFRFVTHKVARWVILIVFTALLGFLVWSATRIEPSAEEIQFYRENNNYGKASALAINAFVPSGTNFVFMYLVWGLMPTDFSACHFSDWNCTGNRVYDDIFDINTPQMQSAISDFCHKLKFELSPGEAEALRIRNDSATGQLEIDCFMDNLQSYMMNEADDLENTHNVTFDLSYPLTQNNMLQYMSYKPEVYDINELTRQFHRYFEIGVSSWLSDGYSMLTTDDYLTYNTLVGEQSEAPFTQPVRILYNVTNGTAGIGFYGTKLRYVTVRVNLTLPNSGLGYVEGLPVMDRWETFFNEQTLENGAWFGITVGIAISFVVLVLATMNIVVGLLATLMIGCVTAGVLGVIPLAGWKIDVMISMNLTLLVGLSVDYIVHIAEGYHLSEHTKRKDRVRDMLENLGISILNGALTTLGAAFFMLFSKITFFFQFGTFLFCIIGFSMAFSLMFFPALMSLIGPEGNTGSIVTPFKMLHYHVIGRSKTDVTCSGCHGKGFREPTSDSDTDFLLQKVSAVNGNVIHVAANGPYTDAECAKDEDLVSAGNVADGPCGKEPIDKPNNEANETSISRL